MDMIPLAPEYRKIVVEYRLARAGLSIEKQLEYCIDRPFIVGDCFENSCQEMCFLLCFRLAYFFVKNSIGLRGFFWHPKGCAPMLPVLRFYIHYTCLMYCVFFVALIFCTLTVRVLRVRVITVPYSVRYEYCVSILQATRSSSNGPILSSPWRQRLLEVETIWRRKRRRNEPRRIRIRITVRITITIRPRNANLFVPITITTLTTTIISKRLWMPTPIFCH